MIPHKAHHHQGEDESPKTVAKHGYIPLNIAHPLEAMKVYMAINLSRSASICWKS